MPSTRPAGSPRRDLLALAAVAAAILSTAAPAPAAPRLVGPAEALAQLGALERLRDERWPRAEGDDGRLTTLARQRLDARRRDGEIDWHLSWNRIEPGGGGVWGGSDSLSAHAARSGFDFRWPCVVRDVDFTYVRCGLDGGDAVHYVIEHDTGDSYADLRIGDRRTFDGEFRVAWWAKLQGSSYTETDRPGTGVLLFVAESGPVFTSDPPPPVASPWLDPFPSATVVGDLEPDHVRRVVEGYVPLLQFCYGEALKVRADLQGDVVFRFDVLPGGHVREAAAAWGTLDDPALLGCVRRQFLGMLFPVGGSGASVTWPLRFSLSGGPPLPVAAPPAAPPPPPGTPPRATAASGGQAFDGLGGGLP